MPKYIYVILSIIFAFFIKGGDISFAQTVAQQYSVHPPQVSVPTDDTGGIKRTISQFKYWTLICDEDTAKKTVICNVRQLVYDENDGVIFSWSLAASADKQPFILMRVPTYANNKKPIAIKFDDLMEAININYIGCDRNFCTAQTALSPLLMGEISKGSIAHITYATSDDKSISFDAPLLGLKNAVQSIQLAN